MCGLLVFLFFGNLLVCQTAVVPIIIRSDILSSGDQFQNAKNSAASLQKGIFNNEEDALSNKAFANQLSNSAVNTRYGEQSGRKSDHLDANHFNNGQFSKKNGAEGVNVEDKTINNKGHHKNGFHNSYHKDEVGSNSSFYDDSSSEGGHHIYKNDNGAFGNEMQNSKKGDHVDASQYDNQRGNQGYYKNGESSANDNNKIQNYNRRLNYDDRVHSNERNLQDRYGDEKRNREHYSHSPHVIGNPYDSVHDRGFQKKRITIYEDPRYDGYANKYNDDYIELDVIPARRHEYRRQPPPFDYY